MVVQQLQDAWRPRLYAVLIVGLVSVHPHRPLGHGRQLINGLGPLVAVADILLRSLLDIDDNGQGQGMATGPDEVGRCGHRKLLRRIL